MPRNSGGATPMIEYVVPFNRNVLPTALGAPANFVFQKRSLITAYADAPMTEASSGANVRPNAGRTPSAWK